MNSRTSRIGRKDAPPATPPAAQPPVAGTPAAGTTPPAPKPDNELSVKEITDLITKTVQESLTATLPEHMKKQLTIEQVQEAVRVVMAARQPDAAKAPDAKAIGEIATEATKAALGAMRQASKAMFEAGDSRGDRITSQRIEVPVSWSKGNLPLHGKQLLNIVCRKDINDGISEDQLRRGEALGDAICERARRGTKALDSTTGGSGDEFVPTDLSSELQRRLYLQSTLYSTLAAQEVVMPSQPYQFPLTTTRPTFYYQSTESTGAQAASNPGTGSVSLDAKKFMAKVLYSYEVDEDSIIPILPWIQEQLAAAAAESLESVFINGDTTGTHQDSDTHAITAAAEKAFKGFRKLALAGSISKDISSGGISAANIRAMLKLMVKYGVNPQDLLIICGIKGYNDLLALTEVLTVDKAGTRATLFSGTLASLYGIPIIVSAACRENLNASGVYDGSTTTKGSILIVNRTQWVLGRRREFTVESFKDITIQQTAIVASFRRCMVPMETPSATIASVVLGYNYTA